MGILEIILGIIIFLLVVNIIWALIPIPKSIGGLIILIIVIYIAARLFGIV
jgi:hypothetical protein